MPFLAGHLIRTVLDESLFRIDLVNPVAEVLSRAKTSSVLLCEASTSTGDTRIAFACFFAGVGGRTAPGCSVTVGISFVAVRVSVLEWNQEKFFD